MDELTNPWKILSEKCVYDNDWITVTEFDVINPNGGEGIYGKIHFKNIAVGVLPLDENLDTYLVGQYRFPLNAYSWEIPEGGGTEKENPLEYAVIYLATQLEQLTPRPEETEKLQVKKFTFEEVYQMVERGLITDSISVAAILKVRCMLADGRVVRP
jgi:hypothetical protein